MLTHGHSILQIVIRMILLKYKLNHINILFRFSSVFLSKPKSLPTRPSVYTSRYFWLHHLPLILRFPLLQPCLPSCWALNIPWMQLLNPYTYHSLYWECPSSRSPHGCPTTGLLNLPSNVISFKRPHPNHFSPMAHPSLLSIFFPFILLDFSSKYLLPHDLLLLTCGLPTSTRLKASKEQGLCLFHCTSPAPG